MRYTAQATRRRWPKRVLIIFLVGTFLVVAATVAVRIVYNRSLAPLSSNQTARTIVVEKGANVEQIAAKLEKEKIIRSAWAFRLYVSSKEVGGDLKAGSYDFAASQSVSEIVGQLTGGRVATNLVTILPGQRLDQIRKRLIQDGFSEQDVNRALDPAIYVGHPALVDKPANASLEGYIYPESYQKDDATTASSLIGASLDQMNEYLTPELRSAFVKQGLTPYQAITLASIVEREVPRQEDREQVAQVFLSRLRIGMRLQSDATGSYGAVLAGQPPKSTFDSAYNTYSYAGLTPTPISNVTLSSLKAVAYPANTDWLYFVSGDDGVNHFSKTLAEHQAKVVQYCKKCTP